MRDEPSEGHQNAEKVGTEGSRTNPRRGSVPQELPMDRFLRSTSVHNCPEGRARLIHSLGGLPVDSCLCVYQVSTSQGVLVRQYIL